jgi:hypothetical protein
MSTSKVDIKRYELINQCYTPFVHGTPPADSMQVVTDKDRSIFWCVTSKKYLIFNHTAEVPGLKVRLTSAKSIDALL